MTDCEFQSTYQICNLLELGNSILSVSSLVK